jgi:hypothetical protein
MKVYSIGRYPEPASFVDVKDLSITASLEEIQALAAFFARAAKLAEGAATHARSSWHVHLRDEWRQWDEAMNDVIISLAFEDPARRDD